MGNIYVCISGCYSDQSIDEIHTTKDGCRKWWPSAKLAEFDKWDGADGAYVAGHNGEFHRIEVCELTEDSPKFLTPVRP